MTTTLTRKVVSGWVACLLTAMLVGCGGGGGAVRARSPGGRRRSRRRRRRRRNRRRHSLNKRFIHTFNLSSTFCTVKRSCRHTESEPSEVIARTMAAATDRIVCMEALLRWRQWPTTH